MDCISRLLVVLVLCCSCFVFLAADSLADDGNAGGANLTPPAVPLVACDPYFSIWSTGRQLADGPTTHWTGRMHRLYSVVRVDGKCYRLMGSQPERVPAMQQTSLVVTPTRSIYEFEADGVQVELTFMTPSLPHDIDLLSRPITYVTYDINSIDQQAHAAEIYFAASAELVVNEPNQEVAAIAESFNDISALRLGSVDQQILQKRGDDLRIDWGYFYLAAEAGAVETKHLGNFDELRDAFLHGELTKSKTQEIGLAAAGDVAAAVTMKIPQVGKQAQRRTLVLAYDDLYSIEYMGRQLRPYWRRDGLDAQGLLTEAIRDYGKLADDCSQFDQDLMEDLRAAGGEKYAQIAAAAYRQCFAAGKFVADDNGQPIQFCKENNSNGCIGTSDVFYPMSPQFLLFGPTLAKSFIVPFMEYAASDRWKFPFAPHDLGTYPKANGQVYGGGETSEENQMPVEESGNMLLLFGAVAKVEGNADFAGRYWPQLTQWAEYLKQEGFDPDNQLCTDDFAGHLAHNVNLSAKAICGLGAFAKLCEMRGEAQQASEYHQLAKDFAARWIAEADEGDHYRLAFDQRDSWSQKYNLVWDRILGLDLFPESVLRKEMDYYHRVQNKYGLPLDNRREYTKLDWILWTATLTQNQSDFERIVSPVYRFLQETPDRVPMTDWYETKSGRRVGFTARPVVGGVFMQMLQKEELWRKWAAREQTRAGDYAKMPLPPQLEVRLAAADSEPVEWKYTTDRPSGPWQQAGYDDSSWATGVSGFGTRMTPNARIGTEWNSSDIWLRRSFDLPNPAEPGLKLHVHYDEDSVIYINGVLACKLTGYATSYEQLPLREEALVALKPSGNVMAVHCHQTGGGQYIDVGFVVLTERTAMAPQDISQEK